MVRVMYKLQPQYRLPLVSYMLLLFDGLLQEMYILRVRDDLVNSN